MNPPDHAARALAFLFAEGGDLSRKKLAALVDCKESEIGAVLQEAAMRLEKSGMALIDTGSAVSLGVAADTSAAVQEALKRELARDIGDAGLEVLAIVLYMGPSTRARVDYVRGVNSSSTLRNLLARGLLERVSNPVDAREYLYRPTVELLAHLGIADTTKLPDYATIVAELSTFEQKSVEIHDGGNERAEGNS